MDSPLAVNEANSVERVKDLISQVVTQLGEVILEKPEQIKLALACFLAGGHLLIEDLPGLGKTVLAQALGQSLGLEYQRVQFTSDLLPGDIIGTSIYDRNRGEFTFHRGPVFSQLMVADEINRATPKAQSALLEAMEEGQVSVDGQTYPLPSPFFVVATQNPVEQLGTYPLPESQLDRFLLRIEMGYPSEAAEAVLFRGEDRRQLLAQMKAAIAPEQRDWLKSQVDEVYVSDALLAYLQRVLKFTRHEGVFAHGLSTRAALGLLKVARCWALIHGEYQLLPGDIQAVLPALAGHRLQALDGRLSPAQIGQLIITSVSVDEGGAL